MCGEADGSWLYWLRSEAALTVIHNGGNKLCPELNALTSVRKSVGVIYSTESC